MTLTFFQNCFGYSIPSLFRYKFQNQVVNFNKRVSLDFDWDCTGYRSIWGERISKQYWVFQTTNMVISHYLYKFSFISLLVFHFCQITDLAHTLLDLYLNILFFIINCTIFISISNCSLFVYKNKIHLCTLTLHTATLLNSLTISSYFFKIYIWGPFLHTLVAFEWR